jgi:hypothetical protein
MSDYNEVVQEHEGEKQKPAWVKPQLVELGNMSELVNYDISVKM